MKGIIVAAVFLVSASSQALACFPGTRLIDNQTVDTTMSLRSGTSCVIAFGNSDGPMEGVRIDQRPRKGVVDTGSVGRLRYRPNRGFIGTDSFTYTRYGKNARNQSVWRSVRVAVTVTP